jgi:hypothetical protein
MLVVIQVSNYNDSKIKSFFPPYVVNEAHDTEKKSLEIPTL